MRYDPLNPEVTHNPYPHCDVLRREDPVFWLESMQAFAITRYDDVKAVLMNPKDYSSEKFWDALLGEYNPVPHAKWMISTDPPDHLRLRKLANTARVRQVRWTSLRPLPTQDWRQRRAWRTT